MNQMETVLAHLKSGKPLTQLQATKLYGIIRLAPIIHNLRKKGYVIERRDILAKKSGNFYAEYSLVLEGEDPNEPSLFGDHEPNDNSTGERKQMYDTLDTTDSALQQGNPPEVGGIEVRSYHVGNPGDLKQILESFKEYCSNFGGKRVPITADWSRQLIKLNRGSDHETDKNSKQKIYRNRNVKNKKLEAFKQHMRDGTFIYTNVGIGFDEDGWLVDGQTRLKAGVATGMTFYADVSFDLPREAFYRVDSYESARTNADFAYMSGINEHCPKTVAAVSILYRKDHGLGHTSRLNPDQIIEALETYSDIGPSIRLALKIRTIKAPKAIIAAVYYLASKINKDVADKAFSDLATGEGLQPRDPVLVARERFIKAYSSRANEFRGVGDKSARVLLSRMFNYRHSNIKVSKYLLDGGDDWPEGKVRSGPEVNEPAN